MEISVEHLRGVNGEPSFRVNGLLIHSLRDPITQARRHLEQYQGLSEAEAVVLVDPGWGYLAQELLSYSNIKSIFVVFSNATSHSMFGVNKNGILHCFDAQDAHLKEYILNAPGSHVPLIVWPPMVQALTAEASSVVQNLAEYLRVRIINTTTGTKFMPRWIKNTCLNLLECKFVNLHKPSRGLAILAASGPSLDRLRPWLQANRSSYILHALPSSLRALASWGLHPDVLYVADGGFWSLHHQNYLPRDHNLVVVSALRSRLHTSIRSGYRVLPFAIDDYEQGLVQVTRGLKIPRVGDNGSVVGHALSLINTLHDGPIIVAGLDMAGRDIQTHVRPHSFDSFSSKPSLRTSPLYSQRFCDGIFEGMLLNTDDGLYHQTVTQSMVAKSIKNIPSKNPRYSIGPDTLLLFPKADLEALVAETRNNQAAIYTSPKEPGNAKYNLAKVVQNPSALFSESSYFTLISEILESFNHV